jgi:ATPases of the AAA+ class
MARSDLLVSLVRAGAAGDRDMLKSTAEALVAEERAQNHHIVADRLEKALSAVPVTPPALTTATSLAGAGKDSILEIEPRVQMSQLLLPLPVQQGGQQLIEEHVRADVLRAHGYEPRHRVLLSGPPGNGKTSFAEATAEALGLPFFMVRYDALIGSYLGERILVCASSLTMCVLTQRALFSTSSTLSARNAATHTRLARPSGLFVPADAARSVAELCDCHRRDQPCRTSGPCRVAPVPAPAGVPGSRQGADLKRP